MENSAEKHNLNGTIKISVNSVIAILVATVLLLLQWFVLEDASATFRTDASYWIDKILQSIATYIIMISFANILEEYKKKKDEEFNKKIDSLDTHYQQVHNNGEVANLDKFILNLNKQTKYSIYIIGIKKKIKKANKIKNKEKRKEVVDALDQKLLLSVEEVWEEETIKYSVVSDALLFSGAIDIPESLADENDLHEHRGKEALKKLLYKCLFLIAFGFMTGDLVYSFNEFTKEDIVPMLLKIFQILWSCYAGCTFGITLFDNSLIVLRKKLRILSMFRAIQDGDKNFELAVPHDLAVERAKIKFGVVNTKQEIKQANVDNKQVINNVDNVAQNGTQESTSVNTPQIVVNNL